jgi:hypothetical protein
MDGSDRATADDRRRLKPLDHTATRAAMEDPTAKWSRGSTFSLLLVSLMASGAIALNASSNQET